MKNGTFWLNCTFIDYRYSPIWWQTNKVCLHVRNTWKTWWTDLVGDVKPRTSKHTMWYLIVLLQWIFFSGITNLSSFNIITLLSVCWLFMFIHVITEIEHRTSILLNFIFRNGWLYGIVLYYIVVNFCICLWRKLHIFLFIHWELFFLSILTVSLWEGSSTKSWGWCC